MKYMLQVIGYAGYEFPEGEEPRAEDFVAWVKDAAGSGVLVDNGYLGDYREATSVQVDRAGERIVTNGPFPETREFLGGWMIVDVPDLDAALDWAARSPGARHGRMEVRPVLGG